MPGAGPGDAVPDSGFQTMDITPPMLFIDLDPELKSVSVDPGGTLTLAGPASSTNTFSGTADVRLRLSRVDTDVVLPLGEIRAQSPVPERWRFTAEIPADLPPGSYRRAVEADCFTCGTSTTVLTDVTVMGPPPAFGRRPLLWVVVGVGILVFVLLRRRARAAA